MTQPRRSFWSYSRTSDLIARAAAVAERAGERQVGAIGDTFADDDARRGRQRVGLVAERGRDLNGVDAERLAERPVHRGRDGAGEEPRQPLPEQCLLRLLNRARAQGAKLGILEVDVLTEKERDDVHLGQRRIRVERIA